MSAPSPPRVWAEIDGCAVRRNLEVGRSMAGRADIMAVVKADAYGHGLEAVAEMLRHSGVSFFGVANVGEARRLRAAGVQTRVFLLGATWSGEREEVVANGWIPCISSVDEAIAYDTTARHQGRMLDVHLAVDTGMGRGGFLPEEIPSVFPVLEKLGNLEFGGICSHLACADTDPAFTERQLGRFREAIGMLGGPERFRWRHVMNSAGLLGYDGSPCNLLRMGLMMYGVSPLPAFQEKLSAAMSLKSRVILVHEPPPDGGRPGRTDAPRRRLALVGAGYGDGYPARAGGNGGEVWIKGKRFPISGRIAIDHLTVDVTTGPLITEGDEVELFGEHVPVAEVAGNAGTIPWEILTGIAPWVERVYR
ncbi:alanine racemase [Luteolibacter sp. SL250]|uniref:alanine racemase n=1 Tax=Luteolibacter sp. SL250 TaxID=2995170 RepID=UPI00226D70EE|nr:alanine racemase [Luteolibacter sp. SL250]WAC19105.1 alanine racemase [Luteolibacter sp. SL250]